MKKIGLFFIFIATLLGLVGCDADNTTAPTEGATAEATDGKVVPIYQGMSFHQEGSSKLKDNLASLDEDAIEDSITNDFGVIVGDDIEYFAKKGEKGTITLNFYNPSQYEILSFILNGKRYQSFQFKEDSTSERINITVDIPNVSGLIEYQIEEVRYIDGQEIKNCIMDGAKIIKVGVLYDNLPSATVEVRPQEESVDIKLNVVDTSKIVENVNGMFRLYLFDGLNIRKKHDIKLGNNEIHFDWLEINHEYTYVLAASLDLFDGKGARTMIIEKGVFRTNSYIKLINEKVTGTEISFEVSSEGNDIKLEYMVLHLEDGRYVGYSTDFKASFTKLKPCTHYELLITFYYNDELYNFQKSYVTMELEKPAFDFDLIDSYEPYYKSATISVNLKYDDPYNVIRIKSCLLLKDGQVISSRDDLGDLRFVGLIFDTEYTVRLEVVYNLQDGTEEESQVIEKTIRTKKLKAPKYKIEYSLADYKLSYRIDVSDEDKVSYFDKLCLYKINNNHEIIELVDTVYVLESNFYDKLQSNTKYLLVCEYSYDLVDGAGKIKEEVSCEINTPKEIPTIEINVNNITGLEADYSVFINDPNATGRINHIKLYNNSGIYEKDLNPVGHLSNLFWDTKYTIVVNYIYNLDDGTGTKEIEKSYVFMTKKREPEIEINATATKHDITLGYSIFDIDHSLTLKYVRLYRKSNNSLVYEYSSLDECEFSNLLAGVEYRLDVCFRVDLNTYAEDRIISKEITTEAYSKPIIASSFVSTDTSITPSFTIQDKEGLFSFGNVELYKGDELISTKYELNNIVFDNLTPNTIYRIKFNYSCDLHDGEGVRSFFKEDSYTTLSIPLEMTGYDNLNGDSVKTNEPINIRIYFNNSSNALIDSVIINGVSYAVKGGNRLDEAIVIVPSGSEVGMKSFVVDGVSYVLNGISVLDEMDKNNIIEIDVLERLEIIKIASLDGRSFMAHREYGRERFYYHFIFNNIYDYEIVEISFENVKGSFKPIRIDRDNWILFSDKLISTDSLIDIEYIKYINSNRNEVVINLDRRYDSYTDTASVNEYIDDVSYHQIRTPEDLLNTEAWECYELANDIDMRGYTVSKKILGFIDGRGHKISNFSFVYNQTTDSGDNNFWVFSRLMNVELENIYVSFTSNQETHFRLGKLTNCIISGNIIASKLADFMVSFPEEILTSDSMHANTIYALESLVINDQSYEKQLITKEEYTEEFKKKSLMWDFVPRIDQSNEDFSYYVINNSYIVITGYIGTSHAVVIPDSINGLPVIGIVALAFKDNKTITSITMGNSLIYIGGAILSGCSNLEEMYNLNGDLGLIGYYFGCIEYEGSYEQIVGYGNNPYLPLSLRHVEIGKSLQKEHFVNATSIKSITLLDGIKEIPVLAFRGSSLETIVIPDSVTSIGSSAFSMTDLKAVEIPDSVITIGDNAFSYCYRLNSVKLPAKLKVINEMSFYGLSISEIVIPGEVTEIREDAFANCSSLINVLLPEGLIVIDFKAFRDTAIKEINLPSTIKVIGAQAFEQTKLISIKLPEGIEELGAKAFSSFELKSVYLPKNIKTVGADSIKTSLAAFDVYYNGTEADWAKLPESLRLTLERATIHYNSYSAMNGNRVSYRAFKMNAIIPSNKRYLLDSNK